MHLTAEQKQALHPINIIVFFLSLYVIIALVVDTFFPLSAEVSRLLHDIDYVICIVFLLIFCIGFLPQKRNRTTCGGDG